MPLASAVRGALSAPARYLAGAIRRQLVLAVVVVHAILIIAFATDLGVKQIHALDHTRLERAQGLAEMLATSSSSWVLSSDVSGLKELIDSASSNKDLRYAMILSPSGKVLAATDASRRGMRVSDPVGRSLEGGPLRFRVLSTTDQALDVASPIIVDGDPVGWAWVSLSRADVHAAERALIWQGAFYVLVAILIGVIVAVAMAHDLTKGLMALVVVVTRFRNGDRDVRVENRRRDELGVVGGGLNEMLDDIAQSERRLMAAHDEAQAANRAKSEFLANMSHEIRTPLNGVIGLASALESTTLTTRQKDMVKTICESAVSLADLLSGVLDSARLEAGAVELQAAAFPLADRVRRIASLFEATARGKGLAFEVLVDPAAETHVEGDALRLEQILNNLLSNAVKFTQTGGISVALTAATREAVAGYAFNVRDTGVGFDPAASEAIFQRFAQADSSITRKFGGAGLGLSISRRLTELMGGELRARSEPGQGSEFSLWLPLPTAAAASVAPAEDIVVPAQTEASFRVLIADDHPTNRKIVGLILDTVGVELTAVEDGALAVAAFEAQVFDAILMDIQMPVMDGLTAIRRIRTLERDQGRPRTPILTLTANALPEMQREAYSAGADQHLTKPIAAGPLIAALQLALAGPEPEAVAV
jgi:signal transduction histidine kinase/ActR/RegA family two-component response regulator